MAVSYKVPDLPLFDAALLTRPGGKEACCVRFEEEIKRSRFITTLARADSRERALSFVESVRREFPTRGITAGPTPRGVRATRRRWGRATTANPTARRAVPCLRSFCTGA